MIIAACIIVHLVDEMIHADSMYCFEITNVETYRTLGGGLCIGFDNLRYDFEERNATSTSMYSFSYAIADPKRSSSHTIWSLDMAAVPLTSASGQTRTVSS